MGAATAGAGARASIFPALGGHAEAWDPDIEGDGSQSVVLEYVRYLFDIIGLTNPYSIATYVSEVKRQSFITYGRELHTPALYKAWLHRMRQVPRPRHHKAPAPRALVLNIVMRDRASPATRITTMLAWYCCCRLGELTQRRVREFKPVFSILRRDIFFDPEGKYVRFRLPHSKGDKYNQGGDRFLMAASPGAPFCPVQMVRKFYDETAHFAEDEPFLRHADGRNVTRRHVVDLLKKVAKEMGLDPATLSGHSLRIGSATAQTEAGVPVDLILAWGNWTTFEGAMRYMRMTSGRATIASEALRLDIALGDGGAPLPEHRLLASRLAAPARRA